MSWYVSQTRSLPTQTRAGWVRQRIEKGRLREGGEGQGRGGSVGTGSEHPRELICEGRCGNSKPAPQLRAKVVLETWKTLSALGLCWQPDSFSTLSPWGWRLPSATPTSPPDALKRGVSHGPACLQLVHRLGIENRREVAAGSYRYVLSGPSACPSSPRPHGQLSPPHFPPKRAAAVAPAAAVPMAAIGSPENAFLQSFCAVFRNMAGWERASSPLLWEKTTEQPALKRKQGSKLRGEKLQGRGCISVGLHGTTRERWQLVKSHEQTHQVII